MPEEEQRGKEVEVIVLTPEVCPLGDLKDVSESHIDNLMFLVKKGPSRLAISESSWRPTNRLWKKFGR